MSAVAPLLSVTVVLTAKVPKPEGVQLYAEPACVCPSTVIVSDATVPSSSAELISILIDVRVFCLII